MQFRLVDVLHTSRNVKFVFSNEGTFQLVVKSCAVDSELFNPFHLYNIEVSSDASVEEQMLHKKATDIHYSKLGVVVRKTRKSTHIMSGTSHWSFPKNVCSLKPGISVWICVDHVPE